MDNVDFDAAPPCPACGGALVEHDHRQPEDLDGWWGHYDCTSCGWELPDQQQRLTYWTAPWTRPLVHMIVQRTQERDDARRMLGECYLLSGADPDGNTPDSPHLWPYALEEVQRMRQEYEEAIGELVDSRSECEEVPRG